MNEFDFITEATVDAPVILSVRRTGPNSIVVLVYGNALSRLRIYYPDSGGTLVFDQDDPTDAALVQINGDLNSEITIEDLDIRLGAAPGNYGLTTTATDTVLTTQSEETVFNIPAYVLGGGTRTGRSRRIGRINRI